MPANWRLGSLAVIGHSVQGQPIVSVRGGSADAALKVEPDLTIWFHQPFGIVDRSGGDPFVERRFESHASAP